MGKVSRDDIRFGGDPQQVVTERVFRDRGDQRYSLDLKPAGIVFEVDRLRRDREGLGGELHVSVNGSFPHAKTVDGSLMVGDMNLSAVRTRQSFAKLLAERSDSPHLDWYGFLEEFCIRVLNAERAGKPGTVLADVPDPAEVDDDSDIWQVGGFPVPADLPLILFGAGSAGKSYFAMWIAGLIAQQRCPVLYADWEFSQGEHRKRIGRLFQPIPKGVIYARCDHSIPSETERLRRLMAEHGCRYVVCDSVGFAVDGPAEAQDSARTYFKAIRQLGVGTLSISHTPKNTEEGKDATVFGSTYFTNGARSVWFIERAVDNPPGQIQLALHHRKTNIGPLQSSLGYRMTFEGRRTRIEAADMTENDELASGLPVVDRIVRVLKRGALTRRALADAAGCNDSTLRAVLRRHAAKFTAISGGKGPEKIGIRETSTLEF